MTIAALFAVNRELWEKQHVGSLFSNMSSTLAPNKGKAFPIGWLHVSTFILIGGNWLVLSSCITACLESFFSFAKVKDDGAQV